MRAPAKKGRAGGPRKDDLTLPPYSTPSVLDTSGMPPDSAVLAPGYVERTIERARELPVCPTCGIHPLELVLLREELHGLVVGMRDYRRILVVALKHTTPAPVGDPGARRCEGCGEEIGTSVVPGYCIRCRPGGGS